MDATDPPTLPPQMFTTSAQLLDLTDKKLMVALRDGRKLIGVLRAWDQRIYTDEMYADVPRGVFIVRGENVLLLGEIDLDKEDDVPLPQGTFNEAFTHQKREATETKRRERVQRRKLRALGFEDEGEVLH
ncbi:Similar to U6 snRNA-associated Sm-like protein LSm1; acc. no. P87173 [Pyronema omphalodes CBS 100304]|uniref:U6 snRNA-associated Sm-like protein LSm1 n=1 Tax=Pyronema omphalodes (strain CBS 100304) TaxID=1076935 RepID=U4KX59_PYROM|nr:Similar to U6 snRNA-associated Sm-like protein LSm1; acc. no. P87173 [Pyronema omphalodes CBS 100304]